MTTLFDTIELTGVAGPYFTIPLGDAELIRSGYSGIGTQSSKGEWKGSFGAMLGVIGCYPIGPGVVFADIRYVFDFGNIEFIVEGESLEVCRKSALHFGVGYKITIGD